MPLALSQWYLLGRTAWTPLVYLFGFRRGADLEERPQDPFFIGFILPILWIVGAMIVKQACSVPAGPLTVGPRCDPSDRYRLSHRSAAFSH